MLKYLGGFTISNEITIVTHPNSQVCVELWLLGWYDMYARCMLGYTMIDEWLGLFEIIDIMMYV